MVASIASTRTPQGSTISTALSAISPTLPPESAKSNTILLYPRTHVKPEASSWNVSRHVAGRDCCSNKNIPLISLRRASRESRDRAQDRLIALSARRHRDARHPKGGQRGGADAARARAYTDPYAG